MTETSSQLPASETGDARDEILTSIRRNLATSLPFDAVRSGHRTQVKTVVTVPPVLPSREKRSEDFRANLESVGDYCVVVSDETEALRSVAETIKQMQAQRVAISDSKLVAKLVDAEAGAEIQENPSRNALFNCDIGVTSAQWAIAETGTLVLESELESHRLISLVPPVHLCILRASSIRQSMGEILELMRCNLSRTITFITGASRTSDIELTLAIGVHGPRELHVIVIADQ
jgi:L-lactate dehydrogenase complex protein LldG